MSIEDIQGTDMSQLHRHTRSSTRVFWLFSLSFSLALLASPIWGQSPPAHPVTITAQVVKASITYRLNGNIVEDRPDNSLIKRLTDIAKAQGTKMPVILIIDSQAKFSEVGKLETALDKVGFSEGVTIYVANFASKTMNQIHWDSTYKPMP